MSHQEKQRIFDQLSQNLDPEIISQGPESLNQFEDWEDVLLAFRYGNISLHSITVLIFEACNLVQEEQQKRIAENVMMKNHDGTSKKSRHLTYFQNGADNIQIDKDSIINPENKIQ